MRKTLAFALIVSLVPTQPLWAAAQSIASFDVRADGFRFGALTAVYRERPGRRYTITLKGKAQGILGFFLRAGYDGISKGSLLRNGRMQPEVFYARTYRIFKKRVQRVDFLHGFPVKVAIAPKRDMTEMSDPAKVTDLRLDPLSFLGLFIQDRRKGCPAPANMYDGRRLTRVSFAEQTGKDDGHIRCNGTYEIVEGPDHSILPGIRSFPVSLDYAPVDDATGKTGRKGRLRQLQRIEVRSGVNRLVLTRVSPPPEGVTQSAKGG